MASQIFDPEDRHYCYQCEEVFPSAYAIFEHRRIKFAEDGSHIHCSICGLTFLTKDGRDAHIRQTHPKEQDLNCPGCKAHFIRAAGLMAHLEHGECPKISKSQLDAKRIKKLAFAHELEKRASPNFPLTAFDTHGTTSWEAAHARPVRIPLNESSANKVFFKQEFPPVGSSSSENRQLETGKTMQVTSGYGQTAVVAGRSRSIHDSHHAAIAAEKYRDPFIGLYRCPELSCRQTFKTARGITDHLQQPGVHTARRKLQCPMCFKWFKDVVAMTAHAESQSKRCNLRFSQHYRPFIDQLTAGVVDAVGVHEDSTVKYEVSKDATDGMNMVQDKVQQAMIDYRTKALEDQATYWDNRPISAQEW